MSSPLVVAAAEVAADAGVRVAVVVAKTTTGAD
jgi:hypothetical protein